MQTRVSWNDFMAQGEPGHISGNDTIVVFGLAFLSSHQPSFFTCSPIYPASCSPHPNTQHFYLTFPPSNIYLLQLFTSIFPTCLTLDTVQMYLSTHRSLQYQHSIPPIFSISVIPTFSCYFIQSTSVSVMDTWVISYLISLKIHSLLFCNVFGFTNSFFSFLSFNLITASLVESDIKG